MSTMFTIHFDGQFWVGVLESQGDDGIRAVKVTFGPEPSGAELYEWSRQHGTALLERLDAATAVPDGERRRDRRPNAKRAIREAARAAREPRVSTAAQAALKADQEAQGRASEIERKQEGLVAADARRKQRRERAKAKHRGR